VSEATKALAEIQVEEWRPDLTGVAFVERDVGMLGEVLHAVVHAGAGVSFFVPFSLDEARAFAEGIHAQFPGKKLAYN